MRTFPCSRIPTQMMTSAVYSQRALTVEHSGTRDKLQSSDLGPGSVGVTEQGMARSASAQKRRLLNLIKFCTWKSCYSTPLVTRGERVQRGRPSAFIHSLALSAPGGHGCPLGKA